MAKRLRDVCALPESEPLWRAGRGFVVRDLPWTVEKLRVIGRTLLNAIGGHLCRNQHQQNTSPVGAANSANVAPTELGSFWNRQATKLSALTGFSRKGESSAVPVKLRAPGNPVIFSWCGIRP